MSQAGLADSQLHFTRVLERNPDVIWNSEIGLKLKESLKAFKNHRKLANGVVYGSVVRHLSLADRCPEDIAKWAREHACTRSDDVLKEPKANTPLHDAKGKTVPLVSFLCNDGGVIRMKPVGDPTNQYDRAPLASIAMRFYGNDRYDNFTDEAFKLDNAGLAIPKWPRDLNQSLRGLTDENRKAYVEEWAHDAHTHLVTCR